MALRILLVYGDLNSEITLRVYKVDEDLDPGKRYYSNYDFALGQQVGTFTGKFKFYESDTVIDGTDTV